MPQYDVSDSVHDGQTTILTVVGARPQFVKAAPVTRALAAIGLRELMVHTGQHHDASMSDVFFSELGIPAPAYNLGIHGGQHGAMTGRMLSGLEAVMIERRPALVLVYGDTNSTLAGALAAAKLNLPVAHVEAGLRSFNRRMPEELNRLVTDHLSTLLFCPTAAAIANLAAEGILKQVHAVGDVMFDATLMARGLAADRSQILERLQIAAGRYCVLTIHRAENTDDPALLSRLLDFARSEAGGRPVIFPVHPRTAGVMQTHRIAADGLVPIDPVGFIDMARLLMGAAAVFTDSGGLQKECYFHRVPCVTLRGETEWMETIEAGWNRLWNGPPYNTPRREIDDYGCGRAAEAIARVIADHLSAECDRRGLPPSG